jgi:hypothetical protein
MRGAATALMRARNWMSAEPNGHCNAKTTVQLQKQLYRLRWRIETHSTI